MSMALGLHWLRPEWLLALLALPVWVWLAVRRARDAGDLRRVVDAHLLPHVTARPVTRAARWGQWSGAIAYVLAVIAMAGPSTRQADLPLWREEAPLVVAMDLSSATLQQDLPPSRLAQSRAKLERLLGTREGGQVGLVVYAGDAFTVAPLTDDAANVAVFLDALAPEVMPVDGQRMDRAIAWSVGLLRQAGFTRGDILVMGDHATPADVAAAGAASASGFRVSVLGVGAASAAGTARGFDEGSLQRLARTGKGRYSRIALDDADLQRLGVLAPQGGATSAGAPGGQRQWLDQGYWLLPAVLLLVLPLFRRGAAIGVVVLALGLPLGTAHAADWWRRPDQVDHARMELAIRQYRAGNYEAAAKAFAQVDSADAQYNLGNALAKAGHYPQAIEAYDRALRRAPGMADAIANRRAVEAAMQRRPPSGAQGAGKPQQPGQTGEQQAGQNGAGRPDSAGTGAADSPSNDSQNDRSAPPRDPGEAARPPRGNATSADAAAQAQADAAQRARMRKAMGQGQAVEGDAGARPSAQRAESAAERERRIANEAWLRRVPDDPGGLLREKFRLEYERRLQQGAAGP